jgi:hypothetical protein
MDRVPSGGHCGGAFDSGEQALDLQSRIVFRIAGDEIPDGMEIAPGLG